MGPGKKYPPELRERAVQMVFDLHAEVELDEGWAGGGVQRVRPGGQEVPDDRLAPSLMPRNLYQVGTSISVP